LCPARSDIVNRTRERTAVACSACSIFSEEATARGFIARKVWPDADDIEAAGSVRNKLCQRRFPHRSGDASRFASAAPARPPPMVITS
jgi:hypothetical protein